MRRQSAVGLINDQNLTGLRAIVQANGYTLVKAHNSRIVEVRRFARPVCIEPGGVATELPIGGSVTILDDGSVDYDAPTD